MDGSDIKTESETEDKILCSKENPAATENPIDESNHYMSLKGAQDGGGQSSASVYESLVTRKKQPIAYENVKLKEESNSGGHYQPLLLAKQESKDYAPSHYQSLNLNAKPMQPCRSSVTKVTHNIDSNYDKT